MRRFGIVALALGAVALPTVAFGHAERTSYYPNFDSAARQFGPVEGKPPVYRSRGPSKVVCKRDSARRTRSAFRGRKNSKRLKARLALIKRCRFRHIQAAVNAARSGDRILIMPGVYREEPSRDAPIDDPRCAALTERQEGTLTRGAETVATYEHQRKCPHAENLIAIVGDDPADPDRRCDDKCNLQIEGMGRRPPDVVIEADPRKVNGIRADRANGIYIKNLTIQYAEGNNIYVHETDGFRIDHVVTRWVGEYGVLSFMSDNGIYEHIEAYGAGDSGVYPGAGPEGRCQRYGIEIRYVDSYHNNLGYSGTAGNGVWVHHSKFHHNAAGIITDSIVPGHPGMPQDCAKWENNEIYSNNLDIYGAKAVSECVDPATGLTRRFWERDPKILCSTFPVPVGAGFVVIGNRNIVRNNHVWDNWRTGGGMVYPAGTATIRGEDPSGQSEPPREYDVNHGNQFVNNVFGVRPDGTPAQNGFWDFLWDGEGSGNCWSGNTGAPGKPLVFDSRGSLRAFPECPDGSTFSIGDTLAQPWQTTCLTWDAKDYDDFPPCGTPGRPEENWFVVPPPPR